MTRLATLVLLGAGLMGLTGCARTLGYAGDHPGFIECKGKGAITGTGTIALGAGVGGAGTNSFTIQADCGDGFRFQQGLAPIKLAP